MLPGYPAGVAATSPPYPTPGWATTQVYPAREAREKQRATEFQNALFASALGKGYRFCLIAGKDGAVVYANPGCHALFTSEKRMAIPWRNGWRRQRYGEIAGPPPRNPS